MDIQPILSYKQLRKINIDTTHSDMKLGTGAFSIVFEISPYSQFRKYNNAMILDPSIVTFTSIIYNKENPNRYDKFKTTQHGLKNEDFFPIFTYNSTLLYDHFNIDTKTYFYNTHACYIYKGQVHWLINDMSDSPILHLKLDLPSLLGPIIICLSRIENTFTLELSVKYPGDNNHIDMITLNTDLDLDIYDTGQMTLGYAERIPTYKYNSYTYKNTLYGNIDQFKIFKDVTYRINGIQQSHNRFENFTQNSKYSFDGIIYHNRDNKMCNVNWLDTKFDNVDYKIKNLYNLDVSIWQNYHHIDGGATGQLKDFIYDEMKEEFTNTVYPILTFDLERKLDETNVEFQQDKYMVGGYYTDDTTFFDSTIINDINIDTIQNKISIFDIFRCQIANTIGNEEDPDISLVQYGNNYLTYISIINDIILYYDTLGINVKNFQIKPNKKMEYTIKSELEYTSIHDINTMPTITPNTGFINAQAPYERIVTGQTGGSTFNTSIFKFDNNLLYSYTNEIGSNSTDHEIVVSDGGIAVHYGNVLKIILADDYIYINPDTIQYNLFKGLTMFASSQFQYESLIDNIQYYTYVNDSFDMGGSLYGSTSKFFKYYSNWYSVQDNISNFDHFSLETIDGTVVLEFDHLINSGIEIYQKIIDTFPIEYLMSTILLIMMTQIDGTKYYFQRFNKSSLNPRLISKTDISNNNEVIETDNDMTVNLSKDHTEIVISFNPNRTFGQGLNFIVLSYENDINKMTWNVLSWSLQLGKYFIIQNDIIPRTAIEKKFVKVSNRYIDSVQISFSKLKDIAHYTKLQQRPDNQYSYEQNAITCLTELELKQNLDNTWYVK